jgi:hypothetical protein
VVRARRHRNGLARNIIRLSVGLATMLSGLYLAVPTASAAVVTVNICESYGAFCIGAPTINLFDPVVETPTGRRIDVLHLSGASYELEFHADQSKCVAASNSGLLGVVHPCNGGSGVVWIVELGGDGHSCVFDSQEFPANDLSGEDNGKQFRVISQGAMGFYQQFSTNGRAFGSNCQG